jgi:RNA polymerase sigma factor (sigma-70 family)
VLVLARTRDREAARDLTQEVMLAVVLALRNGQLREMERLAAFVYGTARNVINNYLRSRNRVPREESIDTAPEVASTPDRVESSERVVLIRRVVRDLDSTDRKILMLTLVEGLKPGEIAARLDLTSDVVRSRKSRAVRRMTERVAGNLPDEVTQHFVRAMERYGKADYTGAAGDLRAAAKLDPDAAHIRFFLGVSYLMSGEDSAAIDRLRATIALGDSPYLDEAHWYLARAYLRRRDLDAAQSELRELIQLHGPASVEARRLLMQVERRRNGETRTTAQVRN